MVENLPDLETVMTTDSEEEKEVVVTEVDVMITLGASRVGTIHAMTVGEVALITMQQGVITVLCWHVNWIVRMKKR